jgi:hypothetical protein
VPVGPSSASRPALCGPRSGAEDARMELGVVLTTLIVFALVLATVAGFVAARVLMHAAETGSPHRGEPQDR